MGIVRGSEQLLFAGVNYVMVPLPSSDAQSFFGFQERLAESKLEFEQARRDAGQIVLVRTQGSHLQVQVLSPGPPLGQLLVVAERPLNDLDLVIKEMDVIVKAYEENWGVPQQIVSKDVTLRYLLSITKEHAFQYLWEERLGQAESDLSGLGGPVQGGGLRFVIPPMGDRKCQIELKIESFLSASDKLFIETVFTWPEPEKHGSSMHPEDVLGQARKYALGTALDFADTRDEE